MIKSRRTFIKKATLASLSTLLGSEIVFGSQMPKGYLPVAVAEDESSIPFGKHPDMIVLNNKPWNIESRAHLLNDAITPVSKMFVRNNGLIPKSIDASQWKLKISGESARETRIFTLQDLKDNFSIHTYQLTLECGGNGRSEFNPPAKGNQWEVGAVSCASWTGIRLRDVLQEVGVKDDAVYIGYYGADIHLSGNPDKDPISRGIPIEKAWQDETLLAFKMNGEDIPVEHGYPLRLIAGGWPASASGKWIDELVIRDRVHDGQKMKGQAYRVPCHPVLPGEKVVDDNMCIIESMPVKSLITFPKSGAMISVGRKLKVNGHAWAGEFEVTAMEFSIDFGATWHMCELNKPVNRLAWQQWSATVQFPKKGYYEIWARAQDETGKQQPMIVPGWNPKGYLNNACHRIAVKVVV